MAIISMGPSAYYQKLHNEYLARREREEFEREQPIINAQVELLRAQAEYYRAEVERIRNTNRRKQHS